MTVENQNTLITDLHAHSREIASFLPPEGIVYTPRELVEHAGSIGLGGIAHTPHDTLKGAEEALIAGRDFGVVVTPGVEVTSLHITGKHGVRIPHIIALFPISVALDLESEDLKIPRAKKPKYVAEWVHDQGGVAIVAHPKPKGDRVSLSFKQIAKFAHVFDGVEIETRCKPKQARKFRESAEELGLAVMGSSDAHDLEHVGVAVTEVSGLPDGFNSDNVIEAIRERRTQALVLKEPSEKHMVEGPLASQIRRYRQVRTKKRHSLPEPVEQEERLAA
ncbi:MAG: PHP-associated domain-containing protein [Candidatus Saccharimonadales bacterium]